MDYITISDIHFGHKRTPTNFIIKNLKKYLLNSNNKDVNVIFINGDMFDRLLDLNEDCVHEIIVFFNDLLNYCHENDIWLRILEGTPSHDWQQSYLLVKLNNIRENKVNLKYFNFLDIEYMEKFNKYVLYIPDEWINDHKELEKQISNKLNEHSIDKVDYAMLHGQFEYQVLGSKNVFYFKEDYFLSLVKEYIHIGHHHTYSNFDRIYANGSFDRLAFGEENKKGYIKVTNSKVEFIENLDSYVYKSFYLEREKDLNKLYKDILSLPKDSYIRLQVGEKVDLDVDKIRIDLFNYHIKIQKISNINVQVNESIDDDIKINTFNIENVKEYLYNSIVSKNNLNEDLLMILDMYLEKFV